MWTISPMLILPVEDVAIPPPIPCVIHPTEAVRRSGRNAGKPSI